MTEGLHSGVPGPLGLALIPHAVPSVHAVILGGGEGPTERDQSGELQALLLFYPDLPARLSSESRSLSRWQGHCP